MAMQEKADNLKVLNRKLAVAERLQHTLMRELSHRMRNQYAVILAMARAVGNESPTVAEFQAGFSDRLHSMSRPHDLLTRKDWKSVPLRDLISSELEAFSREDRLDVQGHDVWLKEQAVVNMGMALHELATNASKHGAWSGVSGKVTVSWRMSDGNLHFTWRESGGPPTTPGEHRGFGSAILRRVVPSALQGTGKVDLLPDGLCWTLSVPVACLDPGEDSGECFLRWRDGKPLPETPVCFRRTRASPLPAHRGD